MKAINKRLIVNASPLICLFNSGLESILRELPNEVAIPGAVWDEILAAQEIDRASRMLPNISWLEKIQISESIRRIENWDLGDGETQVLTAALQENAIAVIDDAEARRCARVTGGRFMGTGGLILVAKRADIIGSVTECLQSLKDSGLWLSDEIYNSLIEMAKE